MIDQYFEAFRTKDLNSLKHILHPQIVLQDPIVGKIEGMARVLPIYEDFFIKNEYSLGLKRKFQKDQNLYAVEFSIVIYGKNKEDQIVDGIDLIEIRDNKILSVRAYLDMRQNGREN